MAFVLVPARDFLDNTAKRPAAVQHGEFSVQIPATASTAFARHQPAFALVPQDTLVPAVMHKLTSVLRILAKMAPLVMIR